jgi:hypothetical protein
MYLADSFTSSKPLLYINSRSDPLRLIAEQGGPPYFFHIHKWGRSIIE